MPSTRLRTVFELSLNSPVGQCRAMPVNLAGQRAILAVYGADFDDDPYHEMFFYPTDTLKMILFDMQGEVLWRRDLGRGVVPGIWFCPVFPFDLDGDGTDEIYYVGNANEQHPLSLDGYRLEQVNAGDGSTVGQWPWPAKSPGQVISHAYRNFITGGHVSGEPVLITAQGTYGDMHFQAWRKGMASRWEYTVKAADPGARGSHMCAISDMDGDGDQELLWGERCIELDTGRERFCADRDTYRGHSDVAQPFRDPETGEWYLYTIRESDRDVSPRVAAYTARGERIWGHVDEGHMDMGWVARLNGRLVASAIRIGHKTCGPDGRFHTEMTEFAFDALTGDPIDLGLSTYRSLPVDINGDGNHELVRGRASGSGEVVDGSGAHLADLGAPVAMASKFLDLPGEQLLTYHLNGTLKVWADANAQDSDIALQRYAHPLYEANRRLTGTGYNLVNLGGIF